MKPTPGLVTAMVQSYRFPSTYLGLSRRCVLHFVLILMLSLFAGLNPRFAGVFANLKKTQNAFYMLQVSTTWGSWGSGTGARSRSLRRLRGISRSTALMESLTALMDSPTALPRSLTALMDSWTALLESPTALLPCWTNSLLESLTALMDSPAPALTALLGGATVFLDSQTSFPDCLTAFLARVWQKKR